MKQLKFSAFLRNIAGLLSEGLFGDDDAPFWAHYNYHTKKIDGPLPPPTPILPSPFFLSSFSDNLIFKINNEPLSFDLWKLWWYSETEQWKLRQAFFFLSQKHFWQVAYTHTHTHTHNERN